MWTLFHFNRFSKYMRGTTEFSEACEESHLNFGSKRVTLMFECTAYVLSGPTILIVIHFQRKIHVGMHVLLNSNLALRLQVSSDFSCMNLCTSYLCNFRDQFIFLIWLGFLRWDAFFVLLARWSVVQGATKNISTSGKVNSTGEWYRWLGLAWSQFVRSVGPK